MGYLQEVVMNYDEVVNYIEEIPKFTSKNPPEHTKELLRRMHIHESGKKIIHVAGTNGKGSVCSFMDAMLRSGGYRVGLFTSPHLVRINERFMIDGKEVENALFVEAFAAAKRVIDAYVDEGHSRSSYFETLFLMGMYIFDRADVDFIVLETGMGGRLDATNVIARPLLCVITSISKDHMQYLGDTIPKIAGEKAGIIKHGVPVVFDAHDSLSADVIRKRAKEMEAPFYELTPDMYAPLAISKAGIVFDFHYPKEAPVTLAISSIARYQMMNASLAYFAAKRLAAVTKIPEARLISGLKSAVWAGRMETVLPGVIIDGAHNEDGVAQFIDTVVHFKKNHRITVLFAAVADKRYADMIGEIAGGIHPDLVVCTQITGSRVVPANTLARLFRDAGCDRVIEEPDIDTAFASAYRETFPNKKTDEDMLFCVGSLYLAGELKSFLAKDKRKQESVG